MRLRHAALLVGAWLFLFGCASVPLRTAMSLSTLTPQVLAQIDPAQLRLRLSVPRGFELNLADCRLTLTIRSAGAARTAPMSLTVIETVAERRPAGLFQPDVEVSTHLLALDGAGARALREVQSRLLVSDPEEVRFAVQAPFARVPPNAVDVSLWADLRLWPDEPFMPLIDAARIRFEQAPDAG